MGWVRGIRRLRNRKVIRVRQYSRSSEVCLRIRLADDVLRRPKHAEDFSGHDKLALEAIEASEPRRLLSHDQIGEPGVEFGNEVAPPLQLLGHRILKVAAQPTEAVRPSRTFGR